MSMEEGFWVPPGDAAWFAKAKDEMAEIYSDQHRRDYYDADDLARGIAEQLQDVMVRARSTPPNAFLGLGPGGWRSEDFELVAKRYGVNKSELVGAVAKDGELEALSERFVADGRKVIERVAVDVLDGRSEAGFDFMEAVAHDIGATGGLRDWFSSIEDRLASVAKDYPACWGGMVRISDDGLYVAYSDFERILPARRDRDLWFCMCAESDGRLSLSDIETHRQNASWLAVEAARYAEGDAPVYYTECLIEDNTLEDLASMAKARPDLFDDGALRCHRRLIVPAVKAGVEVPDWALAELGEMSRFVREHRLGNGLSPLSSPDGWAELDSICEYGGYFKFLDPSSSEAAVASQTILDGLGDAVSEAPDALRYDVDPFSVDTQRIISRRWAEALDDCPGGIAAAAKAAAQRQTRLSPGPPPATARHVP